jgi:DNA-binding CsgD family transcriptional regulator
MIGDTGFTQPGSGAGGSGVHLTPRQIEILQLTVNGLSARGIARILGRSARTIEDHFTAMRKRTGTHSLAELAAWGVAAGIVSPGREPRAAGKTVITGRDLPAGDPGTVRIFAGLAEALGSARPGDVLVVTGPHGQADPVQDVIAELAAQRRTEPATTRARGHGGRPTVMTQDRIEAARAMLPSHSIKEIARKIGVSRSTLYAHMNVIQSCTV